MIQNQAEHSGTNAGEHETTLRARQIAFDILRAVLERKQALDQILDNDKAFLMLDPRDKGFVRMITATTLRRLGQIDNLIERAADRSEPPSPPSSHTLLRMGAAQLCFMASADYAAVDTSVELAERNQLSRQKGFINAVLREIGRNKKEWLNLQDEARLNTPEWLMRLWIEDYGLRTAAEIAQANLHEAPLDISIKDKSKLSYWAEQLNCTKMPTGTLRTREGGSVKDFAGFEEGSWWIQDVSAAIPATLFGPLEGHSVIDMCAAPGGKTAQLAAMGAFVTAIDRSTNRLKRLDFNIQRLGLTDHVKIEVADSTEWRPVEPVQRILLDAPCSATGTIRRHPDVLHLKQERDLERLIDIQKRILHNALDHLGRGGILIYCTCSLQKAEGEYQIKDVLTQRPDIERLPIKAAELGNMEDMLTPEGDIRILPFHMSTYGGMDGFFISRLTKK